MAKHQGSVEIIVWLGWADGIDLLNVSFEGASAPDRVSAISGLIELQQLSPSRK